MASSPFGVDWNNREAVIAYARTFGPGHTVYKHPDRMNFNIIHTSNLQARSISKEWIVFQT